MTGLDQSLINMYCHCPRAQNTRARRPELRFIRNAGRRRRAGVDTGTGSESKSDALSLGIRHCIIGLGPDDHRRSNSLDKGRRRQIAASPDPRTGPPHRPSRCSGSFRVGIVIRRRRHGACATGFRVTGRCPGVGLAASPSCQPTLSGGRRPSRRELRITDLNCDSESLAACCKLPSTPSRWFNLKPAVPGSQGQGQTLRLQMRGGATVLRCGRRTQSEAAPVAPGPTSFRWAAPVSEPRPAGEAGPVPSMSDSHPRHCDHQ